MELNDFLGVQILDLMKKYQNNYKQFKISHTEAVKEIYNAVYNIDCDLKDMNHFFGLLPRFMQVYKKITRDLKNRKDPVILYYRDLMVDIHNDFLHDANNILKYVSQFHFWLNLLHGFYEIPKAFKGQNFLKITMLERVAILLSDSLRDISILRTQIRHSNSRFRSMYSQIEEFYLGIEEHKKMAIALDFPELGKGVGISFSIFSVFILLFGLILKYD